ncbi:Periplasmic copper-binding protein (NosD) [uncultured archaeon]|nr:Periplasmic copper-binding protein (NosD) [uncultured archaeon]
MVIIAAVCIVAVIAVTFVALKFISFGSSTTTTTIYGSSTTSTSIPQANVHNIDSCTTINRPGTYFLVQNINTSVQKGPCINVISSDVKLVGNGNSVTGSGPYSGVPPFSYGILLSQSTNVTVTGFKVQRFSYDLFLNGSGHAQILGNNFSKPTMSGIYMVDSGNSTVANNYVLASDSPEGGINLQSGKTAVINNTIGDNAHYGIVVNSTGSVFQGNKFLNNPVDLVCNYTAALVYSNTFTNSTCRVSNYCEFATCTNNTPFEIRKVILQPGIVNSCGRITEPGAYSLSSNIRLGSYLNTSRMAERGQSCIEIGAPNVNFACNGREVSAGTAVYLNNTYNVTLSDCSLMHSGTGLYILDSFGITTRNITIDFSNLGAMLKNVTSGRMDGFSAVNNLYGAYLDHANGVTFTRVNTTKNVYGIYLSSGGSDVFRSGSMLNNSRADLYCSVETYNATDNLVQNVACGVTDCAWAPSCKLHIQPALASYPLDSCRTINVPGNYSIVQNIVSPGSCFDITSSNVNLTCKGHLIVGSGTGTAFGMNGVSNVSIANCTIERFGTAVSANKSEQVHLSALLINNVSRGVQFNSVSRGTVLGVSAVTYALSGFNFSNVQGTTITQDSANLGYAGASGFIFNNATRNQVTLNNANNNPLYGMAFLDSKQNSIFNNSALSNSGKDYYCSPSSGGLYANPIGINLGLMSNYCGWLVLQPKVSLNPPCSALSSSSDIVLGADFIYPYGGTCFSVYKSGSSSGNNTIIDCNGHAVLATAGGTFVNVVNATNVRVQNCRIINFPTPISASAAQLAAFNNTILNASTGIFLNHANLASLTMNRIFNSTSGVMIDHSNNTFLQNNNFYNVNTGITALFSSSTRFENNTAVNGVVGILLRNSTANQMHLNSLLNMSGNGMVCAGTSASVSVASLDHGGNRCSSNANCVWMTASPQCMPK